MYLAAHGLALKESAVLEAVTPPEADFYVAAQEDAIAEYGIPGLISTDQGSQF